MKTLIIAAFIILSAMNDCKLASTEYALISLEAEDRTYSSVEYDYPGGRMPTYPHEFQEGESSFSFSLYRELYAGENHGCMLTFRVDADSKFTLNTRYQINAEKSNDDMSACIKLYDFDRDGKQTKREYEITDGWVIFTDLRDRFTQKEGNRETTRLGNYLFGNFEFTAIDKNNGNRIRISNGKFENLKALKH